MVSVAEESSRNLLLVGLPGLLLLVGLPGLSGGISLPHATWVVSHPSSPATSRPTLTLSAENGVR